MLDSIMKKKSLRKLSSQRLGFLMVMVVSVWGMYLLSATKFRNDLKESDYLKSEIIKLSRQYLDALAKEKVSSNIGSTSNQQTAVLLRNMLDRIDQLENDLRTVVQNSSLSFISMNNVIKKLNDTILKELNRTVSSVEVTCEIPQDPAYPRCEDKVLWMKENWKRSSKFKRHGVNGSVCSFLFYLSNIEDHCPKSIQFKTVMKYDDSRSRDDSECDIAADDAFPNCAVKIEWMKKFWKSDSRYASHGVDGSLCSIVEYLSEVENHCPLLEGGKRLDDGCKIPQDIGFPNCVDKIGWLQKHWRSDPCYRDNGVNGSMCSFLKYLSEIESWCPLAPGTVKKETQKTRPLSTEKAKTDQQNLGKLIELLHAGGPISRSVWIVARLKRLWPKWNRALNNLTSRLKLDDVPRKKILIYIGVLADENMYHFAESATTGGPLGELVQWTDLIASLYLLGHDLQVLMDKSKLYTALGKIKYSQCPSPYTPNYDIIYSDYIGVAHMARKLVNIDMLKCHLRVVDSFGTEARFNYQLDPKSKNIFGFHQLNLKQYNTMFPHSPDNTFLGFVVDHNVSLNEPPKKKQIALVYGKHISMWKDQRNVAFLDIVQKYFEVHATVGDPSKDIQKVKLAIPRYVKNHNVLDGHAIQQLLKETKVFVGLGFPYEGPAPLEAIASGCFYLNPKLIPARGRDNEAFFKQKPTDRKLTSQHPYAEEFIGEPHVYTVDVTNYEQVEYAMKEIKAKSVPPYLPFEFTHEGMLERLYEFTKHQDFCAVKQTWPPSSAKKIIYGKANQGCDQVCRENGLICEPSYFPHINNAEAFPEGECKKVRKSVSFVAPSIINDQDQHSCILQAQEKIYSCVSKSEMSRRLCPCRDYIKGQTALCKDCVDNR